VQRTGDRHRDDPVSTRGDQCTQLLDSVLVGARAEPDVDRGADLEHVPAVEGAGEFDGGHLEAEVLDDAAHGIRLSSA
jgi:hypothetical protein